MLTGASLWQQRLGSWLAGAGLRGGVADRAPPPAAEPDDAPDATGAGHLRPDFARPDFVRPGPAWSDDAERAEHRGRPE
jgi:hypothetical protein